MFIVVNGINVFTPKSKKACLCGRPLVWISFKLYLVVIQPILKVVSFSNKFGKLVCIIDGLVAKIVIWVILLKKVFHPV
nr:hypothetical protein Iba_chr13cCG10490 [Ipomoea batatas]